MKLSKQQIDFIDFAENGTGSAVLQAVAGAGKTTTLLLAAKKMTGKVAILCYNKKISLEISEKLLSSKEDVSHITVGTVHKFGNAAIRKKIRGVQLENDKVESIISTMLAKGNIDDGFYKHKAKLARLVSMAKQMCVDFADTHMWEHINSHFNIFQDEIELDIVVRDAKIVLQESNNILHIIDFDDMVYLPVLLDFPFNKYDHVIVDEAQDTNPARRLLVQRLMKKKKSRGYFVGDKHQAIYSFTGADIDSLDIMKDMFDAIEMPLTVSFRCPKYIVNYAKQWVDHIEHHENAVDGRVSTMNFDKFMMEGDLTNESSILCRNNAPLIKVAFLLIREGIPCKVEGRDIGHGLKTLVNSLGAVNLSDLANKIVDYRGKMRSKMKDTPTLLAVMNDKCETLKHICLGCQAQGKKKVSDVIAWIDNLFEDNVNSCVTLSTIHKSKGREWKNVYWLDKKGTCPSNYATQDWEKQAEINLMYVAATRSMSHLILLDPPPGDEDIGTKVNVEESFDPVEKLLDDKHR